MTEPITAAPATAAPESAPVATGPTCRREITLEIPADKVQKASEKVARDIAKVARVPGFRVGKAPVTLIRRRFADDIQSEVMQALMPESLEKALEENKFQPITRPEIDKVEFKEGEPLKFRAVFEVLPEFELGDYKNLHVQVDDIEVGDAEVDKTLEEMRERSATYLPIEGRPAQDGDYLLLKLKGTPVDGGDPIDADNILCHLGAEETLDSFNENLRGASAGETKTFQSRYPDDYPEQKLAGKTFDFSAEVQSIKEKKLPELNDDFVKEAAGERAEFSTMDEMRKRIREDLDKSREQHHMAQAREKILETLVKEHDFPVPEALVEGQMDTRLERVVRSLAAQGVDPRAVNVDWSGMRERQREQAIGDVKAELLVDRIADAEKIDATDEDVDKEVAAMAARSGESETAFRARLTKQGALDRMKSKLRSDKTIDWLYRTSRIEKTVKSET